MSAMTRTDRAAFSGGLDTSYCVPWLAETYGRRWWTVTVDTGGLDEAAAAELERRARQLGPSTITASTRVRLLRPRAALPGRRQRAARRRLPSASAPSGRCRRRRGEGGDAAGQPHGGARLHRRRQRPGALRGGAAGAGAGPRGAGAHPRPAAQPRRRGAYLAERGFPVPASGPPTRSTAASGAPPSAAARRWAAPNRSPRRPGC